MLLMRTFALSKQLLRRIISMARMRMERSSKSLRAFACFIHFCGHGADPQSHGQHHR